MNRTDTTKDSHKYHPKNCSKTERGSAFVYLLIGIAVFGAINYFISNMGKSTGSQTYSNERDRLMASEIVTRGTQLAEAVTKMRLRGITAAQIDFANTILLSYSNAACTTNKCKVFHLEGGGLDFARPPPGANAGENWVFTSTTRISNGNNNNDIIAILPNISLGVCTEINKMVGSPLPAISTDVPTATQSPITGDYYTGSLSTGATYMGTAPTGCALFPSTNGTALGGHTNQYHYFIALYLL